MEFHYFVWIENWKHSPCHRAKIPPPPKKKTVFSKCFGYVKFNGKIIEFYCPISVKLKDSRNVFKIGAVLGIFRFFFKLSSTIVNQSVCR